MAPGSNPQVMEAIALTDRNKIAMGLDGRTIDIQILASSPEQAKKLYEAIEAAIIQIGRFDLENDWKLDSDGGDRP
jgi:hypothetical protein